MTLRTFGLALTILGISTLASATTSNFSDSFESASVLWSNGSGEWTSASGQDSAPNSNGNPLSGVRLYDRQPGSASATNNSVQSLRSFRLLPASGPDVGQGVLGFVAMSVVLIVVKYRGLIV